VLEVEGEAVVVSVVVAALEAKKQTQTLMRIQQTTKIA